MNDADADDSATENSLAALKLLGRADRWVLLESAFADHDPIAEAYALTLTSAMHGSEVTALDWSLLSEDPLRSIPVRPNFCSENDTYWPDREFEPFELPIGPRTAAVLRDRHNRARNPVNGLIFTDPFGEPYTVSDLEALLHLRCDRAGIAPIRWSWLRFVSITAMVGGERPCVSQTLRYRDASPTGRRLLREAVENRETEFFPPT